MSGPQGESGEGGIQDQADWSNGWMNYGNPRLKMTQPLKRMDVHVQLIRGGFSEGLLTEKSTTLKGVFSTITFGDTTTSTTWSTPSAPVSSCPCCLCTSCLQCRRGTHGAAPGITFPSESWGWPPVRGVHARFGGAAQASFLWRVANRYLGREHA